MNRVNTILQGAAEGAAEEAERQRDGPVNGGRWGSARRSFQTASA